MGSEKKISQRINVLSFDLCDDPLGLKNVVLGGDSPTLSSEVAFLSRQQRSEIDSKPSGGDDDEEGTI